MLNKQQARHLQRARRMKLFFGQNKTTIANYTAFANEVNTFYKNLNEVETTLPQKDVNGNGATKTKDNLKKQVAEDCGAICGYAKSYAIAVGNEDLSTALNYRNYDIVRMKDGAVAAFTTRIYNLLTPLVGQEDFTPYGITLDMLDTMMDDANAFVQSLGQAAIIDGGSNVANKNIDAGLAAINGNIEQFDLLIPYFKNIDPNFVTGYKINAKLDTVNVLHSGIEGTITNATTGQPVENATIELMGTKKMAKTNLKGAYQLIKVPTKDYKVQITAEGLPTKVMVINIPRGKILPLNIAV